MQRPGALLENGTPAKQESGSWKNLYGRLALTLAVLLGTGVSSGAKYNRPRETRGGRSLPEIPSIPVPRKMHVATKSPSFSRSFLRIPIIESTRIKRLEKIKACGQVSDKVRKAPDRYKNHFLKTGEV